MKDIWDFINGLGNVPTGILFFSISLISAFFVLYYKKLKYWWNASVFLSNDIGRNILIKDNNNFVPTPINIEIYNPFESVYKPIDVENNYENNSIELIFNEIIQGKNHLFEKQKYFVLLAPTGVGKSTFLYQLYLKFEEFSKRKNSKRLILGNCKVTTSDFWLEIDRANEERKKIKPDKYILPENTILLIDGFDEDKIAYGGTLSEKNRLNQIISITHHFHKVIIVSRIQFFDGQNEQLELGGVDTNYRFVKLKLSDFNTKDLVDQYIHKRNWEKYTAIEISKYVEKDLEQPDSIYFNPFILSNIEYIMYKKDKKGKPLSHSYDIYEEIIKSWIERDYLKYSGGTEFVLMLSEFLANKVISLNNLNQQNNREEIDSFNITELTIQIPSDFGKTERTFLNCDNGVFKFSHRSILEFFIAKNILSNLEILEEFNFLGFELSARMIFVERWKKIYPLHEKIIIINNTPSEKRYSKIMPIFKTLANISHNYTFHKSFNYDINQILLSNIDKPIANIKDFIFREKNLHMKIFEMKYFHLIPYLKDFDTLRFYSIKEKTEALVIREIIETVKTIEISDSQFGDYFFENSKSIFTFVECIKVFNSNCHEGRFKFLTFSSNLKKIEFAGTNITNDSFKGLENCSHLNEIILRYENNNITDDLFNYLNPLSEQIEILDLSGTKITVARINELAKFRNVINLTLPPIALNSKNLESLSNLINLTELSIERSKNINYEFFLALLNFKNLKNLALTNCSIKNSSQLLNVIQRFTKLESLAIESDEIETNLNDDFIKQISIIKSMKLLSIAGSEISDLCVTYLCNMNKLEWLAITKTNISIEGLYDLMKLPNLKEICHSLSLNDFTIKRLDEYRRELGLIKIKFESF